jgi:hypothetical protein
VILLEVREEDSKPKLPDISSRLGQEARGVFLYDKIVRMERWRNGPSIRHVRKIAQNGGVKWANEKCCLRACH